MNPSFKGIIFDMDGVLVDTEQFYFKRRNKFLKLHQIPTDRLTVKDTAGGNFKEIVMTLMPEHSFDLKKLGKEYSLYKKEHPLHYSQLLNPAVPKVLNYLKEKNYRISLASSSTLFDISVMLQDCQLQTYFDYVVSGEQFKESKPNPEIYLHTLKEMGVAPRECLAIEDSEKGIRSAHDAGIEVWALRDNKFELNQDLADKIIDSLEEICHYF